MRHRGRARATRALSTDCGPEREFGRTPPHPDEGEGRRVCGPYALSQHAPLSQRIGDVPMSEARITHVSRFPAFSLKAGRFLHAHSAEAEAAVGIARELVRPNVLERTEGVADPR
jgi:hypothetical protein